ncbi:MAG: DUF5320 domain-containing protein [Firmicutes bacterium]|nr:DUF5320 domain-containing protein [Bacillota bacterium]
MPRGDGSGPNFLGPMTGRGLGYCSGFRVPGFMNPTFRWGGFSGGRRWRHMYYVTGLPGWVRSGAGFGWFGASHPGYATGLTKREEASLLKRQAEILQDRLDEIKDYLRDLEEGKDRGHED